MKFQILNILPKHRKAALAILSELKEFNHQFPKEVRALTIELDTNGIDDCFWVTYPVAKKASEAARSWELAQELKTYAVCRFNDYGV